MLPSGWTILGIVQHLTLNVEAILVFSRGCCDQDAIDRLAKGDEVWQVSAEVSGSEVFENRTPEERPATLLWARRVCDAGC